MPSWRDIYLSILLAACAAEASHQVCYGAFPPTKLCTCYLSRI